MYNPAIGTESKCLTSKANDKEEMKGFKWPNRHSIRNTKQREASTTAALGLK